MKNRVKHGGVWFHRCVVRKPTLRRVNWNLCVCDRCGFMLWENGDKFPAPTVDLLER